MASSLRFALGQASGRRLNDVRSLVNVAKPVSPEERERIIAAFATGASCNQIAEQFNRSPDTISRIARNVGHNFGYTNALRAHEARKAYGAEWRAQAKERWAKAHDDILDRLYKPTIVYAFGGKFNEYSEHTLKEPDAKTVRDIMSAASTAWRTVNEIDKADTDGAGGNGQLDRIFEHIQQRAGTYAADSVRQTGVDDPAGDGPD